MSDNKCEKCGKAYQDGAGYCPNCGNKLGGEVASARSIADTAAAGRWKRDFLVIAGLIVVVAVSYLLIHESPVRARSETAAVPGHDPSAMNLENLPTDYESLVAMGNETMDREDYALAAELYRRALDIDPTSPDLRTDFGACLHAMGLPHRAVDEFRRVIAENPDHTIARFNLGIVYYGQGMNDSARYYWQAYLEMEPEGVPADAARGYLNELGS